MNKTDILVGVSIGVGIFVARRIERLYKMVFEVFDHRGWFTRYDYENYYNIDIPVSYGKYCKEKEKEDEAE